jgi:hypothetical protein
VVPGVMSVKSANADAQEEHANAEAQAEEELLLEDSIEAKHEEVTAATEQTPSTSVSAQGLRRSGRFHASTRARDAADQANVVKVTDSGSEPTTYDAAMRSSDREQWLRAIEEEIEAHRTNNTFEEAILPPGSKSIGSRWVFKVKLDENGQPSRFKARLVAKGFNQVRGIHFKETFAPTLHKTSLRAVLAFIVSKGWHGHQFDVKTAFLIPELQEEIYMRFPPGYTRKDLPKGTVLRLLRCIYGLKQSGNKWNKHLDATLSKMGFQRSMADPCLYTKSKDGDIVAVFTVYVDDIIIGAATLQDINDYAKMLKSEYKITSLGACKYILGIKVDYNINVGTLRLSQAAYALRILQRFNMEHSNPARVPASHRLTVRELTPDQRVTMQNVPFRAAVGALNYLVISTRPDLAYALGQVARVMHAPGPEHWQAVKLIMRYLKGTIDYGLTYTKEQDFTVVGYSDSDWAGDQDTRQSTGGFNFTIASAAVSWESTKLRTICLSSAEAELLEFSRAVKEALWLQKLFKDLTGSTGAPTQIFEDNEACIANANQDRLSRRLKHMDIRYHFIQQQIELGLIKIEHIASADNPADIFTKPLQGNLFCKHRAALGVLLEE